MTYWNGFIGGIFAGVFVTLMATGYIAVVAITDFARSICVFVLFIIFIVGLLITVYRARQRRSFFNPTVDGFIVGMGWANAVIVFLLYGFRI